MADIGYIALCLALTASVYSAIAYTVGARRRNWPLVTSAKNSLLAVSGLISISIAILASLKLIAWNLDIGWPNWTLCWAYSRVAS